MRKLLILSALLLASTAARAQTIDVNSLMSGGDIDTQQIGQMMQAMKGMSGGGQRAGRLSAAQQQQLRQQQAAQGGDDQGQGQARRRRGARDDD